MCRGKRTCEAKPPNLRPAKRALPAMASTLTPAIGRHRCPAGVKAPRFSGATRQRRSDDAFLGPRSGAPGDAFPRLRVVRARAAAKRRCLFAGGGPDDWQSNGRVRPPPPFCRASALAGVGSAPRGKRAQGVAPEETLAQRQTPARSPRRPRATAVPLPDSDPGRSRSAQWSQPTLRGRVGSTRDEFRHRFKLV